MITEKRLLKISGKYTLIGLAISLFFWFVIFGMGICHAQTQTGYRIPARLDIGGGRMTGDMWMQAGTSGVRLIIGTQSVNQVGTTGVITGTTATSLPRVDFTTSGGSTSVNFTGFIAVYVDGSQVGTSGALSGELDAVGGVGTNNTFNNPTLAGVGTITATFNANGLAITPAEYASVDNATSELQAQINGKQATLINNSPGTVTNVLGYTPPANTQGSITTSLGYTPIQNSIGSITNTLGYTPPANTLGSITTALGYTPTNLGNTIEFGTETTGNTDNITEGSTNKYYQDSRVNSAVGSLSVNAHSDVNIAMGNENDFIKIVGGQLVAGSSSVTVAFPEVTGSATASQLPLISSLLGSATSAQLPTVLRLTGTTTKQSAGAFGQLYIQSSSGGGGVSGFGTLTTTSLVSYYRLTDLTDNFGANTLTNYGTTIFVAGKYGNCATFNGTDQYLQTSVLSTATTNISMFGWVYISSTSLAIPFFNNGIDGADTNGYVLGVGDTSLSSAGNNLICHLHAVNYLNFNTAIGTGWHHVGMTRDATTWRGYVDGVQCPNTFTDTPNTPSGNFTIGRSSTGINRYFNDKIDDVVFYNKKLTAGEIIELYNNTGAGLDSIYTQYSAKYADPVNGNTVFEIFTPGTATTEVSYIYCNASTTVFGLGTNTAVTATSTAYSGWFNGAVRATAFNVASTEKIKENIKPINIKPDLLEAEEEAKKKYIADNKDSWVTTNKGSYTYSVAQTGTGTVTYVDIIAMEKDYNENIELQWASELNRGTLTENVQKEHEKKFWQEFNSIQPKSWNPKENPKLTRSGFVAEEVPEKLKGDDKQTIDPMAVLAIQQKVLQSLKIESDKQKLAYQAMMKAIERLGGTIE